MSLVLQNARYATIITPPKEEGQAVSLILPEMKLVQMALYLILWEELTSTTWSFACFKGDKGNELARIYRVSPVHARLMDSSYCIREKCCCGPVQE